LSQANKDDLNGYKEYSKTGFLRLGFILSARQLGFSVDDIGEIMFVADKGKTPCPLVRNLVHKILKKSFCRLWFA
jgi:DNA-binding transcriptional MerR regulator